MQGTSFEKTNMMYMRFMSDLHLEFEPRRKGKHITPFTIPSFDTDANTVLVLASDIAVAKRKTDYQYFIADVVSRFKHVIWIMGNHEHYSGSVHRSIIKIKRAVGEHDNLSIVENEVVTIDDVDFVCATLWTDFANANPMAMMAAQMLPMNDYKQIRTYEKDTPGFKQNPYTRTIWPQDTVRWHRVSLDFITNALADSTARKKVVVTHHGPSHQSIGPHFRADELNPAYVSPLDGLIEALEPDYWIHGHLHNTSDYNIGHTNVLSNPRGYCTDEYNLQFDPAWTIDLS